MLVLLDESAARSKAAEHGLPFTGVLGILRRARQAKRISSLSAEIQRLRTEARFFISPALERTLLISVGE
jgi:predicted nucleic acid-binding protein